jgi:hypothetical protein
MVDRGYTFDYISDIQLLETTFKDGSLVTRGGTRYRTLLVPAATFMKPETVKHLAGLAGKGATILFWKQLPGDVPGWEKHLSRKSQLLAILGSLPDNGPVFVDKDLESLLDQAGIPPEPMVEAGLQFTRRRLEDQTIYFIANHSSLPVNGWVGLARPGQSALLLDPMSAGTGAADISGPGASPKVYLQMEPGDTRILRLFGSRTITADPWPRLERAGDPIELKGHWEIVFVEGGPYLPGKIQTDSLKSWTDFGLLHAESFAGAARYKREINIKGPLPEHWFMDLGDVRESARVWVNGEPAGVLVAHPFRLDVSAYLREGKNEISIEVTNLSANRIRDLDIRGIEWKKFYDINIVSHLYEPFDASVWPLKPSGLLGPVKLIPYRPAEAELVQINPE